MVIRVLVFFVFLLIDASTASCGYHKIYSIQVAGGVDSSFIGKWPWLAFFQDAQGRHFCGGSLIAPNVVLTTVQCGTPAKILFGRYYTNEAVEGEQEASVKRRITHPDYIHRRDQNNNTVQMEADVALLVLDRNVDFTNYVQPLCLPSADEYLSANPECSIAGWGIVGRGSDASYILQEADVMLRSCQENVSRAHTILCTEGHGVSTCEGDGGGPLVCRASRTAPWKVFGVVSYGICGRKSFFMNVPHFLPWINERLTDLAEPAGPPSSSLFTCAKDGKIYSAGERFTSSSWAYECASDGHNKGKAKLIGCTDKDAPAPKPVLLNGGRFTRDRWVSECKTWTDDAGMLHVKLAVVACMDPAGNEHANGSTWAEPAGANPTFVRRCYISGDGRADTQSISCKYNGVLIAPGRCRRFRHMAVSCHRTDSGLGYSKRSNQAHANNHSPTC